MFQNAHVLEFQDYRGRVVVTNLNNKGLISADRSDMATLLLTIPR